MCTRHTSRPDACERPYGLRLTSHPIPRAGSASEQKRGRSVRAFGKDRAPETKAPARSIPAAVPTPLGPPVGCRPTPSDGIAYACPTTHVRGTGKGKGLTQNPLLLPLTDCSCVGLACLSPRSRDISDTATSGMDHLRQVEMVGIGANIEDRLLAKLMKLNTFSASSYGVWLLSP